MATHSTAHPPAVNQAEVAGAISSYYGVAPGNAAITKLLAVVFPDVESATARGTTSWKSVFPSVLAKYDQMAKDLGLGVSPQQRDIDAARAANPTAAGPKGTDLASLGGLHPGSLPLAMREDGEGRKGGSDRAAALASDVPLSVNGAISYAREIGVNPALAGFFVGGSPEMRDALRHAITNGTTITDDKVKSMRDVSMVIGAVRAGKLKPDDPSIPASVRQIMEDMKKQGIDPATADTKKIKKYLDDNPRALDAAKRTTAERLQSKGAKADAEIDTSLEAKIRAKLNAASAKPLKP